MSRLQRTCRRLDREGHSFFARCGRNLASDALWKVVCGSIRPRQEKPAMLSREENELITRVGQGTPMGDTLRLYWLPALLSREIPEPDCPPARVRLLGEALVAFRDTNGRIGMVQGLCPHHLDCLCFWCTEAVRMG